MAFRHRISSKEPEFLPGKFSSGATRRHSLPKSNIDEVRRQGLQRLLDSPMMQQNDSKWTRQRQRAMLKSRIEAYGRTP